MCGDGSEYINMYECILCVSDYIGPTMCGVCVHLMCTSKLL